MTIAAVVATFSTFYLHGNLYYEKSLSDFCVCMLCWMYVVLKTGKINMTFDLIKKELFSREEELGRISSTIIFSMHYLVKIQFLVAQILFFVALTRALCNLSRTKPLICMFWAPFVYKFHASTRSYFLIFDERVGDQVVTKGYYFHSCHPFLSTATTTHDYFWYEKKDVCHNLQMAPFDSTFFMYFSSRTSYCHSASILCALMVA